MGTCTVERWRLLLGQRISTVAPAVAAAAAATATALTVDPLRLSQ